MQIRVSVVETRPQTAATPPSNVAKRPSLSLIPFIQIQTVRVLDSILMAAVSAISVKFACSLKPASFVPQTGGRSSSVKLVSVGLSESFPSLRSSRLQICCAAKPETVEKVMSIVKKQLALSDDVALTPASTFSELGADSLDTVEVVMGLEEEFGISVEEDSSQNISTVQDAADIIEKLVEQKAGAA